MSQSRQPTYFLSHGGGPWPWIKEQEAMYRELRESLEAIPSTLPAKPKAILMISGHWEESDFTVATNPAPPMIYDFGGFPPHTYKVVYPAPGLAELSARVIELMQGTGHKIIADNRRGFDHGVYSVLQPMYPQADIPVVQLSMRHSLDAQVHIAAGKALAPLRDENILILGSGLSYHNLRWPAGVTEKSKAFDQWLQDAVLCNEREKRLDIIARWEEAPYARTVHPREDHLIPLMVSAGAAGEDAASLIYHELFMDSVYVSSFRFGQA